jgi:hypothetical protein
MITKNEEGAVGKVLLYRTERSRVITQPIQSEAFDIRPDLHSKQRR